MKIRIIQGQKYELKTFNGTSKSKSNISSNEDYWKLIGKQGTLLHFANELNFHNDDRVLFQFDEDLQVNGLECHNERPNSLWILKSDLTHVK